MKLKIQFLSHTSYMSSTRCSPGVVASIWDSADRIFPSLQKVLFDDVVPGYFEFGFDAETVIAI